MRKTSVAIAIVALMLGACSDNEHEVNKSRPISSVPSTSSAVMESMSGQEQGDQAVDSAMEGAEKSMDDTTDTAMIDDAMDKAEEMTADSGTGDVMDKAAEMVDGGTDAVKEMAADSGLMDKAEEMTDSADMVDTAKEMAADSDMMDKAGETVEEAAGGLAAVSMEDGTALAKKSGCFACHSIDRKILGPSWKDVAAKYADDKVAGKAHLLTKVAKGGKGAWADQGIVAPMPPYSPRVSDENIEILVDFVLSL